MTVMLASLTVAVDDLGDAQPPGAADRELSLTVVDGQAHLLLRGTASEGGEPPNAMVACSFQVSARSLLLALRAAWDADQPGAAWCDAPTGETRRRAPTEQATDAAGRSRPAKVEKPRPPQSHQPWTEHLDSALRGTWLAGVETASAREMIHEIADRMGRSPGAVRSRLARLGCDPDVPGRMLGVGSSTEATEVLDQRDDEPADP